MSHCFAFNEADVLVVEWYRAALSVRGDENRIAAIMGLYEKLTVEETDAALNRSQSGRAGLLVPTDELSKSMTYSMSERMAKIAVFDKALTAYRNGSHMALFSAELIAREIWCSVAEGDFRGVYSTSGIIERVSHECRKLNLRGARDTDTLSKHWNEYKGVSHLGAGLLVARAEELGDEAGVLIGEEIRHVLSHETPKGQKKPYVDELNQFSFLLKSVP